MLAEQPEAAVTQRDNSGTHVWSDASLRDLVPPVVSEAVADDAPDAPGPVETPEPMVVEAADESPETTDTGTGSATPIDARSLDDLERDLARAVEIMREVG